MIDYFDFTGDIKRDYITNMFEYMESRKSGNNDWLEGEDIFIPKKALEKFLPDPVRGNPFPNWLYNLASNYGSRVLSDSHGWYGACRSGTFIGIVETWHDYYYYIVDDYGNEVFETCCARVNFI